MPVLSLKDVKEGMELDASVTNLQGYTLAKSGTVVTRKHLKAFMAWGVTEVSIRDLNDESDIPVIATARGVSAEEIAEGLDRTFQKNDRSDPVIREFYRQALECREKALGESHGRAQHACS